MIRRRVENKEWDLILSSVRQCGDSRDIVRGREIHSKLSASGLDHGTFLGNLLVQMYGSCGQMEDSVAAFSKVQRRNVFSWTILLMAYAQNGHLRGAKRVFDLMPAKDTVCWTGMIGVFGDSGCIDEACLIFDQMPERDVVPWNALLTANALKGEFSSDEVFERMPSWNIVTCNVMLQGYSQLGKVKQVSEMFDKAPQRDVLAWDFLLQARCSHASLGEAEDTFERMPQWDRTSWIALMSAYAQAGEFESAKELYDELPEKNVASCTVMIQAYAEQGKVDEAKETFDTFPEHDVISWNAMVVAYAHNWYVDQARCIFERIPKRNLVSWNTIVQCYCKAGELPEAESLFMEMEDKDVISWTAMLAAYGQVGQLQDAWSTFKQIPRPNLITWNAMLNAYTQNGQLRAAGVMFERMPKRNVVAWTTMIMSYALDGDLDEARSMFDSIPEQDEVSWTSMITAYAESSCGELALELFRLMDLEGLRPDKFTYTSALHACSSLVAPREGRYIHACVRECGHVSEASVGTALINMYGKCGLLVEAREILEKMPRQDVGSWTSMIVAYAQNGHSTEAVSLFQSLNLEGVTADYITVVSVLCACSHGGMLTDGWNCFVSAETDYGVEATADQYLCMVGLLGKAGQVDRAEELVASMPFEPDVVAWMILLSACRSVGDSKRGARVAQRIFQMDPENAAAYLLLSNTHAVAGKWYEAAEVRRVMCERGVRKRPGWSFIDFFLTNN